MRYVLYGAGTLVRAVALGTVGTVGTVDTVSNMQCN